METLEIIRKLLAWSTAINLGLLVLATIVLAAGREPIARIHAQLFGLSEEEISRQYFQYLANYKTAVLVFNLVPYAALHIVG
jgi:hypothetical protein